MLSMGIRFLEHVRPIPHHENEVHEQHPEENRRREPPSKTGPHAHEDEHKNADQGPHQVHSALVRSSGLRMSRHPDGPRPCRVIGHDTRPHRADLGVLANRAKRASSGEVQLDREERIFVRRVVVSDEHKNHQKCRAVPRTPFLTKVSPRATFL